MFTSNSVFKQNVVVSNLHVSCNGLEKMWHLYTFHFSTINQTSTHTKGFNIFFAIYMLRCPTTEFQFSIISKWLVKNISTNVSFKIAIRKRLSYIDFGWPWIWNQCFFLGIWIMIVLKWYFCLPFSSLHD